MVSVHMGNAVTITNGSLYNLSQSQIQHSTELVTTKHELRSIVLRRSQIILDSAMRRFRKRAEEFSDS